MPQTPPPARDPRPTKGGLIDPQADLERRLREATVGEYDILGQLGFGGMASVYLAQDLALDRRVAIKVMSPAMVYGPGLVERFRLEAKTAAALSHPNIIPIYAVREVDGLLFFVMKVVEGTSLDAVIKEVGPMPLPMVEALFAQAAGALGYAHRRGVVHRDVKPANILLDNEGWVVVTDFGIAKVAESSALTMTGVAVGTPTYMSPEQCAGDIITGASDQYSLGIVTYEMLTGRPPFVDQSIPALMIGHTTKTPPAIVEVRPDCPATLRAAVERMLAKDPADRFATLEDAVLAAGARPMAPDDSTRNTLVSLARHGHSNEFVAQVRTPRSPVPLLHRSGEQRQGASAPKRRGMLMVGGVIATGVALTALVVMALQRSPTAPANPPTPDNAVAGNSTSPDTAPTATSTSATPPPPSRQPAATPPPPVTVEKHRVNDAARVPATVVPPPPPPVKTEATPPTRDSQVPERTPVTSAAPPKVEPQPRPVVPPPPAAPVVDPQVAIDSVIQAYARALESGKVTEAVRHFPAMPADQRQGLEAFYRDGGTMQTRWRTQSLVISGSTATLNVVGTNTVRIARNRPTDQPVNLRARLERRADGWHLVALES